MDEPLYNDEIKDLLDKCSAKELKETVLRPRRGLKEHILDCLHFEHKNEDGYWLPIPAAPLASVTNKIWGYERSECKKYFVPIPAQLERLQEAKEYVKRYSYDTVARWLSAVTGRKIGYNELYDRINNGRQRQKRAAQLRRWAVLFKRAIDAAQKIEETFVDAGEPKNYNKEGILNLAKKAQWQPLNSIERYTPAAFDDGTSPEEGETPQARPKRGRRGPRRPNRTRAIYRGTVKHL